jgi:hypothetical protein
VYGEIRIKIRPGQQHEPGKTCYDDLYADVIKWMKEGMDRLRYSANLLAHWF